MEIPHIDISQLGHTPLEVNIIHVISPSYFWVHLQGFKNQFEELMEGIHRRMRQNKLDLVYWPDEVREGDFCITNIDNGMWQRGVITKDLGEGAIVVSLKDWGAVIYRKKYHVFRLEDTFRRLPWQAIPCGLAYTAPCTLIPTWPQKVNKVMRLICEGHKGWMRVRGFAGTQRQEAYVDLKVKMENNGDFVHLRSLFKSFGYTRDVADIKPMTQPHYVETTP